MKEERRKFESRWLKATPRRLENLKNLLKSKVYGYVCLLFQHAENFKRNLQIFFAQDGKNSAAFLMDKNIEISGHKFIEKRVANSSWKDAAIFKI